MAKSSKSQFAILGMLALLKKSSGYDLKKHMESSTQYFWKETFSSIYPVLEELEQQQLIVKIDIPTKNDRKRNVYTITAMGKQVLERWLQQSPEEVQLRNELLLKLFFGDLTPITINIAHIEKYKTELNNKLLILKEIKQNISDTNSLESVYGLITLDHGIGQITTALEWCNKAIKTLQAAQSIYEKKDGIHAQK